VQVGSIVCGGDLRAIVAAAADVVGEGIQVQGYLGGLQVHGVLNGAAVTAGGVPAQVTTIQALTIDPLSVITLGSTVRY
jgi:hypothetical protein